MGLPYLTEIGLQQASGELVAGARARRVVELAPNATVLDATCGIGADSCALSLAGVQVVSADLDPEKIWFARANLEHHGQRAEVLQADATAPAVRADALLLDPDRRATGRRDLNPSRWSPTLAHALETSSRFAGACLKLAPALDAELLLEAEQAYLPASLPRRREWLSRAGELVELCLWTGALAGPEPSERQATRLDVDGGMHTLQASPASVSPLTLEEIKQIRWLADPDPAVIRSGLLGNLATSQDLAPLAPRIAYLGGASQPHSPFLRVWRVLGSVALDPRRVRALLAKHDVGPVQVRKRGHPDSPEVLERRFRGRGSRRGELVVARLEHGHRAFLVERKAREPDPGGESGGR
jgi:hypothetical protein